MQLSSKHIIGRLLPFTMIPIVVYSVLIFARPMFYHLEALNNTTFWWGVSFLILMIFFFANKYFFDKINQRDLRVVQIYLLWNIVCIIRGMFAAELYWDWKALIGNTMALLMPIVAYAATNRVLVQKTLSVYIKYMLPLFVLFLVYLRTDAYGFYLVPVSFLLLFFPVLTLRQKLVLILVTVIVFAADLGARSNVIKFGVPPIILLIYYQRKRLTLKMLEFVRVSMFVIPITLFILGATGIFNVFNIGDYMGGSLTSKGVDLEGNRIEMDLATDTRTFLYEEVISSAKNNDYWLLGRTPARGNDSPSFGYLNYELTKRTERGSNEIGLANVFTWTGIIGVILYLFVFFKASYLAVNKSRNIFAQMIGVSVAFRWLYSWVEDVNDFSLNYFMLWIMIGLCFSHSFRGMTNKEVRIWVRGIFDKRYVYFMNYLNNKTENEKSSDSGIAHVS